MEVPRVVTEVQWSKQANDWVPIITIGTGDSAVKYYGIRCPHDGSTTRIPQDIVAADDSCCQRSAGGAGRQEAGRKAGKRGEIRKAGGRGAGETVNAYFVYSCARSLNNIAYTITPYYDDVVGNNTCPAVAMVTDRVLQEVEVVTESSAQWRLQNNVNEDNYGEMVLREVDRTERSLEVMPMMQRVSQLSPAENALMRWRIAGPAKGGDAERWQREMLEVRRGKRGTLEAWTLQGKKLATREALRTLDTLAADYEARARHYEKERERIDRDERTAVRDAERYARRKGFAKEKEEAARKIREIAARRRALEETHTVVYVPEDPASERCRRDTARRIVRPGQRIETPEQRIERRYRERKEKAMAEMRQRAEARRQKTGNGEREQRRCAEPEVVWYKPRRAVGTATAGSLAEAVRVYENTGTESYAQSGVSGPRATPTAQLTKRADTKSNVINTVTATPWRTEREPGSRYAEVDGEYEAVLPERETGGRTVDMEQAGAVEVTRYAVLGAPEKIPDLKRPKRAAERGEQARKAQRGLRSCKSRRRLEAAQDTEDAAEDRDRPGEAPDQFTAVRLATEHAGNTYWTLAATALGDKVRSGEITAQEANELSTKYAPTMQGSFMFPVISYPVVELDEHGQAGPAATRQYIPHLCLGEVGETGEDSDYAGTFGERSVFVDRGSFTASGEAKAGSVEVIPGRQCEIEKDEETGGVAISFYTTRNGGEKTSVLTMPKRGAVWCCSCPYAMTEYANTPYQQTNHGVATTVNSMPTITMGEEGDNFGGTARTEYFSQFVNAGLAMYRVGKQEEFWAAVGTLNLAPTAVSMTTGEWRTGGFTGWNNGSVFTDGTLRTAVQGIQGRQFLATQNVVDKLKPVKNGENMWECAWNSSDKPEPVRDYSLAEMVADAGSFFGTWLETSNGCDMSDFSGEGQALFCSFNIRGGIVANTLVFAGNSFGERLGKGESSGGDEGGDEPDVYDTTVYARNSAIIDNNGAYLIPIDYRNSDSYGNGSIYYVISIDGEFAKLDDLEGVEEAEELGQSVYINGNLWGDGTSATVTYSMTRGRNNDGVEVDVLKVTLAGCDNTHTLSVGILLEWNVTAISCANLQDMYPDETTPQEFYETRDALIQLRLDVDNSFKADINLDGGGGEGTYTVDWVNFTESTKVFKSIFPLPEPEYTPDVSAKHPPMFPKILPDNLKTYELDSFYDRFSVSVTNYSWSFTDNSAKTVKRKDGKKERILIKDVRKNITRQHSKDNQPQRMNAAARKWIEDRRRKEGEKKSISIKDACKNSKRHLMRESTPQRMSRKEREYVEALKRGEVPKPRLAMKVEKKNADLPEIVDEAIMYPGGGFAAWDGFEDGPEAYNGNGGTIQYTVSNVAISGSQLEFMMTLSTAFPFKADGRESLMTVGGSTVSEIEEYLSGYVDGDYPVTAVESVTQKGEVIITGTFDYYAAFSVVLEVEQEEEPADNSYGAPVTKITIPSRVRGAGKPEDDEPGEGIPADVSKLVQPILTTSTNLLMQVDQAGIPCRVKRNGSWVTEYGNADGDISLDPNSFSRMSSLRRPHYSQQMTGRWWSLGDVPVTFISERSGYSQISGAIVGLFTGVIDFFDMEKQVLPAAVKVFGQEEREVDVLEQSGNGAGTLKAAVKAERSGRGRKGEQRRSERSIEGIEDWADPSTNNYEHDGKGVFGRRQLASASPRKFEGTLEQRRQTARTLFLSTEDDSRFSFSPAVAPLFFWHVSWSVNFASPVAYSGWGGQVPFLPTDIPEAEGETYYAKPLFAWTYGVPKTMPNVALMSNIEDEAKRYVKVDEDTGKEYIDRSMTRAAENNVVEFMPGMFGAASLLNVGCDASVDLVAYSTGT